MIAIIDYDLGNTQSVKNAFDAIAAECVLTSNPEIIRKAAAMVLPGVGAAGLGMTNLKKKGLDVLIRDQAAAGKPILGICLGIQLLLTKSEENDTTCLGLVAGDVKKFTSELKVPHIGWNKVVPTRESKLFEDIESDYFYFANSYYCEPEDKKVIAATSDYGRDFCSSIETGNIYGTQFHPEKSGEVGMQVLRNFIKICK